MSKITIAIVFILMGFTLGSMSQKRFTDHCHDTLDSTNKTIDDCVKTANGLKTNMELYKELSVKAVRGHEKCNMALQSAVDTLVKIGDSK